MALALGAGVAAVPLISSPAPAETTTSGSEFAATKKLERVFQSEDADGNPVNDVVDSRLVTVKADKTENLRGRERIRISWSGAHATGSVAVNPYGAAGLEQEYPVVIMQCRGTEATVSPETCWTSTQPQRSELSVSDPASALWREDPFADAADREDLSGVTPFPDSATCPYVTRASGVSTHLTPFKAASGATHYACSDSTMPPEASVNSAFPPAELAAFTDAAGNGDVQFEVRSNVENESLGCSDKVDCSIVVIPILGLSCMPKVGTSDPAHDACVKKGEYLPGEAAGTKDFDKAVSPRYWWSASNWRNRITIPITFGPPPNVCDLLDSRSPVGFYGSELMAQAGLQWAPAYCLDKTRFKFQANKMPDDAAFGLLGTGQAAAAFVSRARDSDTAVGYAPTAITGFSVSYLIDKPDNAGEYAELRLTPRLLAKLLTTSYPAVNDGREHPAMENNPLRIYNDPEFKAINPGLKPDANVAASGIMSLSVSSDVMWTLTNYINRDPEARAFLDGNPDPWGMLVNPAYKGISLPVTDWPLNDTWRMPSGDPSSCEAQNTTPYFTQVAAPVSSLRTIGEAVLDGWPLAQTKTSTYTNPQYGTVPGVPEYLCKFGRIDRQDIGHRFLIGITDLGDAERFGLHSAQLQTSAAQSGVAFSDAAGRTFVGPTQEGLSDALAAYESAGDSVPFAFNPAKLPATGYPGTMIVYTAAPLYGMDPTLAKDVALFMRTSTTEGQVPGAGNGQLPEGYLPLTQSGRTSALWSQAKKVADLVEAQKEPAPTPTPTSSTTTDSSSSSSGSSSDTATSEPTDSASAAAAAAAKSDADKGGKDQAQATTFIETDPTAVKTSKIAALLLPLLILGAAVCMLATPVLRMMISQHDQRDAG